MPSCTPGPRGGLLFDLPGAVGYRASAAKCMPGDTWELGFWFQDIDPTGMSNIGDGRQVISWALVRPANEGGKRRVARLFAVMAKAAAVDSLTTRKANAGSSSGNGPAA